MLKFILLTVFGFMMTEVFSYLIHRFIFHGILWRIHQTHHQARAGKFELNDFFSLFFSVLSVLLMVLAEKPLLSSISFPIGAGLAVYGLLYFVVHDLFTHRRLFPFRSDNKIFLTIRAAHQRHHQSVDRQGLEPFGLFLFDYKNFRRRR